MWDVCGVLVRVVWVACLHRSHASVGGMGGVLACVAWVGWVAC